MLRYVQSASTRWINVNFIGYYTNLISKCQWHIPFACIYELTGTKVCHYYYYYYFIFNFIYLRYNLYTEIYNK